MHLICIFKVMNRAITIIILFFLALQSMGQDSTGILKFPEERNMHLTLLGNELGTRSGICGQRTPGLHHGQGYVTKTIVRCRE